MRTDGSPPAGARGARGTPPSVLPPVALAMTAAGLAVAQALAALVALGVVAVPWDAAVLPWAAPAGLVPFGVVGLGLACVSWCLHRDGRSAAAVLLGLLATAAAAGAAFLIVATGIANHPL